jgi:hypothetical protein
MPILFSFFALTAATGQNSPIKPDEVVLFFPSIAHQIEDGRAWEMEVHGWIHEPEERSLFRRAAVELFRKSLGLEKADEASAIFRQRARWFLVDSERGKRISVRIGQTEYPVDVSAADGHFRGTIRLSEEEARVLAPAEAGSARRLRFQAGTRPGDGRVFAGNAQLVGPTGVSVISDIDDTIKVSNVADRKQLLANTFLREFQAVPGMASLYRRWAEEGAVFHYVSASPWQLYVPLAEFLQAAGFPHGSFHLKDFHGVGKGLVELFATPERTKRRAIEPILAPFPQRKFVLVGDSGELDPEIYGALAREHPDQIARILIRDLTGMTACRDQDRYRTCFAGLPPEVWSVFQTSNDGVPSDVTRLLPLPL